MTKLQRIRNVLIGLLMIACSLLLAVDRTADALKFIVFLLTAGLLLYGIRLLVYYFSMARHMVGGRSMLYRAVIILDFAVFSGTLSDIPPIYLILYLAGIELFAGAIDILRAMEARRFEAPSWKLSFAFGVINILMAAACIVFIRTPQIAVWVYAAGLFISAVGRISQALRKQAIVYIQ